MKFTDVFIKRPILAIVLSLLILLLGLKSIYSLTLREFPKMENTVITIVTTYPGASAELMQGFITAPLQKFIARADGIDYLTAKSSESISTIKAYITLNYDPNVAMTDIMAKVAEVRNELPKESNQPVIQKETGASMALMYIGFYSKSMTNPQITDYIARVVQPKLQSVNGVASAEILGGQTFAMRIWLNTDKMAAFNVSTSDVTNALQMQNFQSAAGQIKGKYVLYNITTDTSIHTADEFKKIIIKNTPTTLVHLEDIAKVELGAQNYDSSVYFNGKDAVFIGIQTTPTANPLTVIDDVKKILPELSANYPPNLESKIVYDSTRYISSSLHEVIRSIAEASIIVVLVIFLFLGAIRTVSIPLVTIPLSLVGVCFLMFAMGYSLNLLTLLAMVLAIGLVVDDAIVVVENIYRHIEDGLSPMQASLIGAREIALPIISMTTTLAAVYAPIGFMHGMTGALFKEFAFTLSLAVILSGVIALTLSPMMCSKILSRDTIQDKLSAKIDALFAWLKSVYNRFYFPLSKWKKILLIAAILAFVFFSNHASILFLGSFFLLCLWATNYFPKYYQKLLSKVLEKRTLVVVFAISVLLSCFWMAYHTTTELAPNEDQSVVFVSATAPEYANIDYLTKFTNQLNKIYQDIPETQDYFIVNGMGTQNNAIAGLILKPWNERHRSQDKIHQIVSGELPKIAGLNAVAFPLPSIPSAGDSLPIQFVVLSTSDYLVIHQVINKLVESAKKSGLFLYIDSDLKYEKPKLEINIDKNKAGLMGINMQDIGASLATLLGGGYVNRFSQEGQSYMVIPQVPRQFRITPERINNMYVPLGSRDQLVPLSSVVKIKLISQPNSLNQFQQLNAATIEGLMMPGTSTTAGLDFLKQEALKTFPVGVNFDYAGQSRQVIKEGNEMVTTFLFALIIIYLVLAAQFESLVDPLIILISVPMSLAGALIFLYLGFATLNIYTGIGLITLIGLISKHGILMVDFANHLQIREGLSKQAAIIKAACLRLRPILMTTGAMVLGVFPLVFADGAGAASRHDIGLVIAAGMLIGTCFTLFVVPAIYTVLARQNTNNLNVNVDIDKLIHAPEIKSNTPEASNIPETIG